MAKNRIAYYTQEGRIQSANINFDNYSNTFSNLNALTNVFEKDIAVAGIEGSKLLGIKLNDFIQNISGTISTSGNVAGFYFSLKYVNASTVNGLLPENTILRSIYFDSDSAIDALKSLVADWDELVLAQTDMKGNKYINLSPGSKLVISCDVVTLNTIVTATSYILGKLNDSDPRSIKIISYLEDY